MIRLKPSTKEILQTRQFHLVTYRGRVQSVCESWSDWRIDRRASAAVRWGQKPAKSCHILRVDRFPSWMSSASITLHTSHYSSSSSFYVFHLQARTDVTVRTTTPNCCDEPWSVTLCTPYPSFASCAAFLASDKLLRSAISGVNTSLNRSLADKNMVIGIRNNTMKS